MNRKARILVFDSGLGGLSVAKALREIAPEAELAYAADNAAFPYGNWNEGELVERMVAVMEKLIARTQPDVVVIACNTASTIGLETLRHRFDVPFVGTVPAIKPAANMTKSGLISVLATPGTVNREYTRALMETYAFHCEVKLHGAENLARMAEEKLTGKAVDLAVLRDEIAPIFVEDEKGRTDVVVLGCTHYPLLLEELQQVAPWPVSFIDPAPAIAQQALRMVRQSGFENSDASGDIANRVLLTGDEHESGMMLSALADFGFDKQAEKP